MFLPVVIGLAAKAKIPPSKLLMPLAFGAILGGSCTLIGTSTNLAVSGAIVALRPAAVLDVRIGSGRCYHICCRNGLHAPVRTEDASFRGGEESLTEQYQYPRFCFRADRAAGLAACRQDARRGQYQHRPGSQYSGYHPRWREDHRPSPTERIQRRDSLIVEGKSSRHSCVKEEVGLEIKPDFMLNDVVARGRQC